MIAKVAFFCAALAAVSASGIIAPLVNTGASARSQIQDVLGNYAFGYNIKGLGATNSRSVEEWLWKQRRDHHHRHRRKGRRVIYIADGHGFRTLASKTNEPGTPPVPLLPPSSPAPTPDPSLRHPTTLLQ
ncbi:hypothetical protein NPIL_276871 [Nephila pilipes]|uniref:Alkaline phosphatase n=1 Tax=Nephila pilipes TaxID=299642 RepID=A0A8X6TJS7_NEPPI|nr:hypothetical protein NPIL_276871 [Nephila pilipes]